MGPITGLATIATALTLILVVAAVAVVGLGLAVVAPAVRDSRRARIRRQVTVPAWYLHPTTAH